MHDPSTVVAGRWPFYSYGTGAGLPVSMSDDGWTWRRAGTVMQAVPGGKPGPDVIARGGNNTWAPDVIRIGDKYFLYYSAPGTQPKAAIGLLVGRTLDPGIAGLQVGGRRPGRLVRRRGRQQRHRPRRVPRSHQRALWLTYGSYFGYIRLVELDPRRPASACTRTAKPVDVAINSEASIMILRDGWYYLLVTHGSCCAGADSSYNIRMGRARKVTGPFLDNMGIDMLQRRRQAVRRVARPLHRPWPLRPARSRRRRAEVLAATTKPTSIAAASACSTSARCSGVTAGPWPATTSPRAPTRSSPRGPARRSSWPCRACRSVAGDRVAARVRRRQPRRSTPFRRPSRIRTLRRWPANWPAGPLDLRLAPYMLQAQQKWTITPVAQAGGYPGLAVFQDHHRRNGSHARRHRGRRADRPSCFHRRTRTAVAHRSAHRRHVSRDAESGAERQRAAGALRRRQQHADTRQVQARQRSATMAFQQALTPI